MYRGRTALIVAILLLAACGAPTTGNTTSTTTASTPQSSGSTSGSIHQFHVGIMQQVSQPALDTARKGVEDALKQSGLAVTLDEKNAQNDLALLSTIADGFRDAKVDLVVAIGTRPLQAAYKSLHGSGIPIVFNAVTNPYAGGAEVAKSATDHPGVSGIQALPPVQDAFDLILKIKPGTKKVGTVWTSNEPNSKVATGIARDYAKSKGIEFVESQVTKADEVLNATENLAGQKVDAIFISTDSTVVSALQSVVRVANENKIGLFCNDPASASRGCTTGLGLDYYDNGFASAKEMAIPILKGTSVDTISIHKQAKQTLIINTAAAAKQGLTIPQAVLDSATSKLDTISAQ